MSMNVLISQGKYSSDGVYQMWSRGEVPKTHFSKPTTHLDLYTNKWINPLGLNQPIWWASMMSIVDLFDKQLPNFKLALESIGIELSKNAFLQYMKNTYGTSVNGSIKLIKVKSKQDSIITLLPFEKNAVLYKLKDHPTPDHTYICKVGTIYEQSEKEYIRPILLIQAQDKNGEANVDAVKQHLLDEYENITEDWIAISTGQTKELEDENLFSPQSKVKIVITVEALKEGWDCSFAYVLASLQNINSATDVEQLLGRVLRMPYAKLRQNDELNKAYAHIVNLEDA
jgi:hypothetical protein